MSAVLEKEPTPTRHRTDGEPTTRSLLDVAGDTHWGYSVLYVVTLVAATVAPALGASGTLVRFGCAFLVLVALVHSGLGETPAPRLRAAQLVACAVFAGVLLLSVFGPVGFAYGLSRLLNWLMFAPLAVLFYRRPDIRALGVAGLVIGAVQSVGVLLQMRGLFGGVWGGQIVSGTDYNPATSRWLSRYTGFVLDPNNLALFFVLAAIVCLAIAVDRRGPVRYAALLGLTWSIYIVLESGSRAGLLAFPMVGLVFAVMLGSRAMMAILGAVIVTSYVAAVGNWDSFNAVIGSLAGFVQGNDVSLNERLAVWQSHHIEFGQYFLGAGFGGYDQGVLAGSGFNVSQASAVAVTVDNSWLKLFLECGVVGVLGLASVLGSALSQLRRSVSGHRSDVVRAGLAAAFTVTLWRSLSTDVFDINPFNALLPILIGAAWSLRAGRPEVAPLHRR